MSIVSSDVGYFTAVQPRKKRNFIAVQRAVPDSSIVSETPRQVPNFCISKHIAKPFLYGDAPKPAMGVVPLKALQEGSHPDGVSLFNAPVFLVPQPLRQVIPQVAMFDLESSLLEDVQQIQFEAEFEYKKGIRPSIRRAKMDDVVEPIMPYPTRAGTPAPPKLKFGTYDQGAMARAILGY